MSTKSGITVSEELLEKFKGLDDILVIKVSEDETQLVPHKEVKYQRENIGASFDELNALFTESHPSAGYVIIPVDSESYSFISFVPDSSPARQKMLYASTKSTALTTLGSNKFPPNQTFEWKELDELSHDNYGKSLQSQTTSSFSEREKTLEELDALNSLTLVDASSTYGFKRKLASMSTQDKLNYAFDADLEEKINAQAAKKLTNKFLIVFNINSNEDKISLQLDKEGIEVDELIPTLSNTDGTPTPKYCLYNYANEKLAFIYSCPSGSPVKSRMTYASFKQGVINHLNGILKSYGSEIDKSIEVGDVDEIELGELKIDSHDIHNNTASKSGLRFSKPKGPRRR